MLTVLQNSTNIRYLLFRLDFNEFYQIREEQKRNFGRGEDEDMDNYGSQDDDDEDDDDEDDDDEDDDEEEDEDDDDDYDGQNDSGEIGLDRKDAGESIHYRSEMQFSEIQSNGGGAARFSAGQPGFGNDM